MQTLRPPDLVQTYMLEHRIIRSCLLRWELTRALDGCKERTYLAVVLEEPRCAIGAGLSSGDEEGPVRALFQKDLAQQHVSYLAVELRQKVDEMALVVADVVPDPRGLGVHPRTMSASCAPTGFTQPPEGQIALGQDCCRGDCRDGFLRGQVAEYGSNPSRPLIPPVPKEFSIVGRYDHTWVASELLSLHREVPDPVSYTHLRAHETRHDLVCRLLLEKKK